MCLNVAHLICAALRRGIKGQKGDWVPGKEVAPVTVLPFGHYFPTRPWPNELILSHADPGSPAAPSPGHLGAAAGTSAAAPHLKSPKGIPRAHEFFVGRARVLGHRELGEGAKGAAAECQTRAHEQP